MCKKWKEFKESLNENVIHNKREYLLILAVCILGGILFGMIITPKKAMTIGSYNGNGYDFKGLGCENPDDSEDEDD